MKDQDSSPKKNCETKQKRLKKNKITMDMTEML